MFHRVADFLNENNILYGKQFGFQKGCSTNHAILQLVDDMCDGFDKGKYTSGIFIDLSKAFYTVDQWHWRLPSIYSLVSF